MRRTVVELRNSNHVGDPGTRDLKWRRLLVRASSLLLVGSLFAISGDGLARQPNVARLVDDHSPSYSPDGGTIVFTRSFSTLREGVDTHPVSKRAVLVLMRADGARKRLLRHAGTRFEYDAEFTHDGSSILFIRDEQIYVMRRDGSGARPLRRDTLEQACPRFSPDGTRISFWRGSARSGAYFVMNTDGSGLRRISGGQRTPWGCPSWFPDGKRVVFTKGFNLYVRSIGSTRSIRITDNKDGTLYRPSVSPDGRWIACDGFDARTGHGIIVMRANGTGVRRITTAANEIENDAGPSWSPDGRHILFSGHRGRLEGAGVYVVKRDGSGLRRLSNLTR